MTVNILIKILGWCAVINMAMLLWWFLFFSLAGDWIYQRHSKWFKIPREKFDAIHYAGMAFYKIAIFMFNLIPYVALKIVM